MRRIISAAHVDMPPHQLLFRRHFVFSALKLRTDFSLFADFRYVAYSYGDCNIFAVIRNELNVADI
jgi:hypothetical protein